MKDERGETLIEYAMIAVTFIAVIAIVYLVHRAMVIDTSYEYEITVGSGFSRSTYLCNEYSHDGTKLVLVDCSRGDEFTVYDPSNVVVENRK